MTVRDLLLADLVEQGVDEALAKTLLDYAAVLGENVRLRRALTTLEEWDMLTLTEDGHGAVTADAPWARALIAKALSGDGPRRSDSPNGPLGDPDAA